MWMAAYRQLLSGPLARLDETGAGSTKGSRVPLRFGDARPAYGRRVDTATRTDAPLRDEFSSVINNGYKVGQTTERIYEAEDAVGGGSHIDVILSLTTALGSVGLAPNGMRQRPHDLDHRRRRIDHADAAPPNDRGIPAQLGDGTRVRINLVNGRLALESEQPATLDDQG